MYMIECHLLVPNEWRYDPKYIIKFEIHSYKANTDIEHKDTTAMILAYVGISIPDYFYHDPTLKNNFG